MNHHLARLASTQPHRPAGSARRAAHITGAILLTLAFAIPLEVGVTAPAASAATCAAANVGITPMHNSIFYADFSPSPPSLPNLAGHYAGYRVTNNTGGAINGAWVQLSNFTGGVVALAPGQASSQPLDAMAVSGSGRGYFYLSASGTTAAAQTHTVSVYDRRPDLAGAVELCNTTFTFSAVTGTTQAAANKVNVATATSNPPGVGALMTMTVSGDTGTIGSGPASDPKGFDMTPAAVASGASAWTPGAFRLLSATLTMNVTGSGVASYSDLLHYTVTDSSSSDRPYTIVYQFRIVATTSASTAVTPIQYIASGTQIKHTSMSDSAYAAIQPIQPISNTTTLSKSASPDIVEEPGGTVTYSVTATNTSGTQTAVLDDFTDTPGAGASLVAGSSTFNGSSIGEPISSSGSLVWIGPWTIPAGSSRTLSYTMNVTGALGTVTNSAIGHIGSTVIDTTTATGDNSPATSVVTIAAAPKIKLTKSVGSRLDPSDQFTVAITNGPTTIDSATTSGGGSTAATGNVTVNSGTTYTLTDAMAGGSASSIGDYQGMIACSNSKSGSSTTLPSGSGTSFTVTPRAGDVISCTITNTPQPRLTLVKSVTSRANAADQFTVAIVNGPTTIASATTTGSGASATTGPTTLTAGTTYSLTDGIAGGSASVIAQYGSSISCTNTFGSSSTILPTGSGTAFSITPAAGDAITCTYANVAGTASLAMTKSASPNTNVTVGTVITYTYAVSNSGSLPLTNVTVTDPHVGLSPITCSPAAGSTLAGAATMSCSATYTVTQTDVDAGSILNTGTVTGKDPSNNTITKTAATTVTASQSATLSVTKVATPSTNVVSGDVVAYSFQGKNTGTVTIHDVAVTDPMPGLSAIACTPTAPAILAPNATVDCTATYTVTQADVDAGSFSNTATIEGLDPTNNTVSATKTAVVTALQTTSFSFTKAPTPATGVVAGDTVTYTFAGRNTGTTTLHAVAVTDPMPGLSAIACAPTAPATLAPDATIDCTATYTVTQADVDAGSFSNTATIEGLDPTNNPVSTTAGTTVNADQHRELSMTKSATPNTGVVAGDTVTYTLTGRNTGVVTLHDVAVADPMPGLGTISCTPAAPATLAPNATIDCSATYTVTQDDIDGGPISNIATVSGLDPSDNATSAASGATVTPAQTASFSFTKTATPATGVVAGDTVTYTFAGRNTGTTTLHAVEVTDPMPGLSAISCTPTAPATLAPDATIDCTATYTVTSADVTAGTITNTATLSGLDPSDNPVTKTAGATVTAQQAAAFTLTKSASPSTGVVAGDTVTYTFAGRNSGTVALHDVAVTDPMPGLSAIACTPTAPATLAPDATIDCTATYTVTQANVDAGAFSNTATIAGLDPSNNAVDQTAGAIVTANQVEDLSLTKTATPTSGVLSGSTITYSMTARNTGTVTVVNTTITDSMPGLSPLACTPAQGSNLAPGATMTCTASYTVTAADMANGSITNTAVASGDGGGGSVSATGAATIPASTTPPTPPAPSPDVRLTKTLDGVSGSTATWLIVVANRGDGALPGPFTATDDLPAGLTYVSASGSGWSCSSATTVSCIHAGALAPGATASVKLVTTITGGGDITNTASIEVLGETVKSAAVYRAGSGIAFTGIDAQRLAFLGTLALIGGWAIVAATRRRHEYDALIER